jgi:hypothetical protein
MLTKSGNVSTKGLGSLKRCRYIASFCTRHDDDCKAVIKNTWSKTKPTVLVLEFKDDKTEDRQVIDLDDAVEAQGYWTEYKDDWLFIETEVDDILDEVYPDC